MHLLTTYIDDCTHFIHMHSNHYTAKTADHKNILIVAVGALPACRHFQLKLQVSLD